MLAGLPVKLFNGLSGSMGISRPPCQRCPYTVPLFHELRVPHRGVENFSELQFPPYNRTLISNTTACSDATMALSLRAALIPNDRSGAFATSGVIRQPTL